ncbi:MAG: septum site-determining protein MinC [Candidatus Magnetoglobus multicellularis str. Araruama]|uniref:Probable septum site-determining protein MinC n=1 Tax=Candidatus Magnetoglobus multicellularis str. Araruama TaxID=890399 RepID=A0A1V1P6R2_9BACT|nr:MAG: septum site-determining protein MinC [Candidatus Magnetoglobus multicellularis str. Araruama]
MKEDKRPVRLKGVGDSLWVSIDPTQSLETLKNELITVFQRLGHLTIQSKVILDLEGEGNYDSLIVELRQFLKDKYNVASVLENDKKKQQKKTDKRKVASQDWDTNWKTKRSDVLMIAGRIRSGQRIKARRHLVVLGDVNPGGEAMAGGDIIVLGSLKGKAVAGQPDNHDAIILALDFKPTQVQIGMNVAVGIDTDAPQTAEFARVEGDAIVVEEYMQSNPFARLHWPQAR